jgi:DNA-directed RNA polymerase specialized sigma24 family protein
VDLPRRNEALAGLHQRYYAEMVRLAFALTGDWGLAEELTQEAFVRAWRRWGAIRRAESAPAYLRTTVVNLARSSLRRRAREIRAWLDAPARQQIEPSVSTDVLRALAQLPQSERGSRPIRHASRDPAGRIGTCSRGNSSKSTARGMHELTGCRISAAAPRTKS